MAKGSKESPYSYDEYLTLSKNNNWQGGYVDFGDGIVKWEPAQEQNITDKTGCGCGSGSNAGSGSGSNDKPQYMVRGGSFTKNTPDQPFSSITIFWSDGIALPHARCGSSNKDGFYSDTSFQYSDAPEHFEETKRECGYETAYEIHVKISWHIPKTRYHNEERGICEVTYSIPEIYHEDF